MESNNPSNSQSNQQGSFDEGKETLELAMHRYWRLLALSPLGENAPSMPYEPEQRKKVSVRVGDFKNDATNRINVR